VPCEAFTRMAPHSMDGAKRCTSLVAAPLFWGSDPGARVSRGAGAQTFACRHLRPSSFHSVAFTPRPHHIGGGAALGPVGLPAFMRQTTAVYSKATTHPPYNKSANTEPQLQVAAPPQWLWPGCLQRYMAWAQSEIECATAVSGDSRRFAAAARLHLARRGAMEVAGVRVSWPALRSSRGSAGRLRPKPGPMPERSMLRATSEPRRLCGLHLVRKLSSAGAVPWR
jgi:hypothetical protein